MKRLAAWAAALGLAVAGGAASQGTAPVQTGAASVSSPQWPALDPGVTAFTHVTVAAMTSERLTPDQTVIVSGGRIVAIGPTDRTRIPGGARRIDGRGKYLLPGLIDMHAHLAPGETALDGAFGRQMALSLANGLTTVRGLIAAPGSLDRREAARAGAFLSPALIVAGPSVNGNSAPNADAARALIRKAKADGFDVLKTHGGLDRATYDAAVEAAEQAGLDLVGHVTSGFGLARAVEAGQDVEHLDGFIAYAAGTDVAGDPQFILDPAVLARVDPAKVTEIARAMKARGTCNGPTLGLFQAFATEPLEALEARPELRYVTAQNRTAWRAQRQGMAPPAGSDPARYVALRDEMVRTLSREGVRLVSSGDSPSGFMVPGFAVHREMAQFVRAGLTPYQALRTATADAAACLGAQGAQIGAVEVGKRADLLLVDADPFASLDALKTPAGVMLRGRWLSREELRIRLDEVAAAVGP